MIMRAAYKWHWAACTPAAHRDNASTLISPGYETPFGDRMLPMRGHRGQNTIRKLNPARARTYCMQRHDGHRPRPADRHRRSDADSLRQDPPPDLLARENL